ncbi:MAG: hypothetical protein QF831_03395 [Candidatus Thalassarchaeaceae archaeon]|nr:hypothetical protein [Candidatus Thalassarchaeaceae archaeon]
MNPSAHPKLQSLIDDGLKGNSRGKRGFLADIDISEDSAWFVCREP